MNNTFSLLMREAARLTRAGQLLDATATLRQAMTNNRAAPPAWPANATHRAADRSSTVPDAADASVIDGCVVEVDEPIEADAAFARSRDGAATNTAAAPAQTRSHERAEAFISGSHSHRSLTRDYKLYIPPGPITGSPALVVMLHGCTQDPDDFAAGTGMNALARERGFFVLYPSQSRSANPSRCWNWFKHNHQRRSSGEPALIASLTRAVIAEHGLDPRRVYVAGLSAGGAMAAIVASAYPELYAAVGVHSGLPVGAAGNVTEALGAMQSGRSNRTGDTAGASVPTIVFHGDEDKTVHPRNGGQLFEPTGASSDPADVVSTESNQIPGGRRYTRSMRRRPDGRIVAEHWAVHGAGHAWSGGSTRGSYVDPAGPDATREMFRFFSENPLP